MKALYLRLRLWWLGSELRTAKDIQERLRKDIPAMEAEREALRMDLFAIEQDQPT